MIDAPSYSVIQISREHLRMLLDEMYSDIKNEMVQKNKVDNDVDEIFTRKEAAKYLKVSLSTLDKIAKYEKLPFYKILDSIRFKKSDLNNYLNTKRNVY